MKEPTRVQEVTFAFKSHLGRVPNPQELKTYLTGRGDVGTELRRTAEYTDVVRRRLDEVSRSLLGFASDAGALRAFLAECEGRGAEAHACSRETMCDFVARSPEFLDKYGKVVDSAFVTHRGHGPDARTRSDLVARFRDEAFTPARLAALVAGGRAGPTAAGAGAGAGAGSEAAGAGPGSEAAGTGARPLRAVESELGFVERWNKAVSRRVDVYEFLRYFHELGAAPEPDAIRAVKARQDAVFDAAAAVYRDFLGATLSFDRFTATHIAEYDSAGFLERLRAGIVAGHEYEDRMRRAVAAQYRRIFDAEVHPEDLAHVFARCRAAALPLCAERVATEVAALGEELRDVRREVVEVYAEVLQRAPDDVEVRANVARFRTEGDDARALLRAALFEELEYHEILKSAIARHTGSDKNSVLFRVLARVIARSGGNMAEAAALIAECAAGEE